MRKLLTPLVAALFLVPLLTFADDYGGPYCFEDAEMNNHDPNYGYVATSTRGTCKKVGVYNSVTLDPTLRGEYLLGTHEAIEYNCERYEGCANKTKYSESLIVVSSPTFSYEITRTDTDPLHVALFDKSFMVPVLSGMFKKEGLPFSEDSFPMVDIHLFKKEELEKIGVSATSIYLPEKGTMKIDTLVVNDGYYSEAKYNVYSFLYQEYAKYIHAPKGGVAESQYAEFEKTKNVLSNSELGIRDEWFRHEETPVVSVTSPLKKVTSNWLYTKKNGKLTLVWQSIDYELDNGTIKNVKLGDKEETGRPLFMVEAKKVTDQTATSSDREMSPAWVDELVKEGSILSRSKDFFQKIFTLFTGWFK